ncbi:MAG: ABC transporter permease subunit [Christensenellaceae bacterium]
MLAVAEDRDAARLMGINASAIITLTFAIGSAAAVAGVFYLLGSPAVYPTLGSSGNQSVYGGGHRGIGSIRRHGRRTSSRSSDVSANQCPRCPSIRLPWSLFCHRHTPRQTERYSRQTGERYGKCGETYFKNIKRTLVEGCLITW